MKKFTLASVLLVAAGFTAAAQPYSIPMDLNINSEAVFNTLKYEDTNKDNKTWYFDTYRNMACCASSGIDYSNDWLFIPVNFTDADKNLELTIEATAWSGTNRMGITTSKTASSEGLTAQKSVEVENSTLAFNKYTYTIEITNDVVGDGFIAIQAGPDVQYPADLFIGEVKAVAVEAPVVYSIPMDLLINSENVFKTLKYEDANNDTKTWYFNTYRNMACCAGSGADYSNDWLFIPVNFAEGDSYLRLTIEATAWMGENKMGVATCKTASAEGLTAQKFVEVENSTSDFNKYTYTIEITNDIVGAGFIAIQAGPDVQYPADLFIGEVKAEAVEAPVVYSIPMDLLINSEDVFKTLKYEDANNDTKTWYFNTYRNMACCAGSGADYSNDWLFIPVNFAEGDKNLKLTIEATAWMGENKMGVATCKTASAEGLTAQKSVNVENSTSDFNKYTYTIEITNDIVGDGFIAIQAGPDVQYPADLFIGEVKAEINDNPNVGIEAIDTENAPVEYYNLSGVRVNNPEKGSLVIARQGNKVAKVIIR